MLIEWIIAALIGAAVGFGELVSRYRDAPFSAAIKPPALVYIALNALASFLALVLIQSAGWTFGDSDPAQTLSIHWLQVLVAGFAAMAVLRTSLFNVRVGGQDVPIGPQSFLQIILSAADREVDRLRAGARAKDVTQIMQGVSFDKAYTALTAYCLALMQNLSAEEQAQLAREIAQLNAADIDPQSKSLTLGLALMNVVGEDVLRAAVSSLGDNIAEELALAPATVEPA